MSLPCLDCLKNYNDACMLRTDTECVYVTMFAVSATVVLSLLYKWCIVQRVRRIYVVYVTCLLPLLLIITWAARMHELSLYFGNHGFGHYDERLYNAVLFCRTCRTVYRDLMKGS